MNPRLRRILAQAGSFVLAGVLLYLALRGVDFAAVGEALRQADYRWLAPLIGVILLSHVLRAWRWQVLLAALPDEAGDATPKRVSLKIAFYSLMIGYMVNYAAPRLGEVARTANLSAREKLSFSGVLGTVVVERILDVIVLALGLVSIFFLLLDRSTVMEEVFIAPLREQIEALPALALIGATVLGAAFVLFVLRWALRREDSRLRHVWDHRVRPVLVSFKDGLTTVQRSPRRLTLVVSTVGIWACYWLLTYMPFLMLDMAAPFNLTLVDAWSLLILGAVGVTIPSPGGLGSYHYIIIQALVHLYAVEPSAAATYAVLSHGAQMVLYIFVGVFCLLLQGTSLGAVRRSTQAARHATASEKQPPPDASS